MIDITYNLRLAQVEIRFHKDPTLLLLVKRIPGRVYHQDRYWYVPIEQGRDLKPYLERFIEEAKSAGHESEIDDMVWGAIGFAAEWKERNYKLSTANEIKPDESLASLLGASMDRPPWRDLTNIQKVRIRYIFDNAAGVLFGSADPVIPLIAIEYGLWFPSLVVCPDARKFEIGSMFKRMTRRQVFVVETEAVLIREAREAATGKPQFSEMCVCNFGNLVKYKTWLSTIDFQSMLIVGGEAIRSGKSDQVAVLLDRARCIPHKILMTTCDFRARPWELCAQLEVIERMKEFGGRDKFLGDYTRKVQDPDGDYPIWKPANVERLEHELRSVCYTRGEE